MSVVAIIVGSAVAFLSYLWYKKRIIDEKLKWLPKVPGLPIFGSILEFRKPTELLNTLTRFCNQYNGLCQMDLLGKPFIVAADYNFLEYLLTTTMILNKNDSYTFLHKWLGSGLLTAGALEWKLSRKILTPAFHFSILEQFVEVFDSNSNILVELLEKEVGKPSVDIFPYIKMNTLDNICESAMGVSINAQTNRQSEYVSATSIMNDTARQKELMKKKVEEQCEDEKSVGDKKRMAFLDLLLQTSVEGQPLSDEFIRQEVDTFMFAGHDTTASAISFTLYCLAKYPEFQDQVVEEQKTIFGDELDRPLTYRDLQEMKYLEMVIKETLRIYPSVPFVGRKTHQDVEYKEGEVIPANTNFIIYIFGVNRNPKFFPDPEKFDPSRFDGVSRAAPYSYIPFSAGPRNCIGQKFAMVGMKSTVSKILRKYELVSCGHEVILAAEAVLISYNGIKIALKKRNWT
ncbi:hypothetical protein JTB14_028351 [Gonioctena quinquepunctata]|nr:hypothetical protein JTB14_028351 [Gonioctena quinquepunctata]